MKQNLKENQERLDFIAGYLMNYESMDGEQFKRAMEDTTVTAEELDNMLAEKRKISEMENKAREEHIKEMEKKREEERARRNALEKERNALGNRFREQTKK